MKAVSVFVAIALMILPTSILVLYIIIKVLTKSAKRVESLSEPSSKLARFRLQYKVLFYVLVSVYGCISFAALSWMFYEIVATRLNASLSIMIVTALIVIVIIAVEVSWMLGRIRRMREKLPAPGASASKAVFSEWQRKYLNELASTLFGRDTTGLFLVLLGAYLIILLILVLFAIFSLLRT